MTDGDGIGRRVIARYRPDHPARAQGAAFGSLERLAALSGVFALDAEPDRTRRSNPTFAVLWGLTRALKIDLSDLIGGVAHRQANPVDVVTVAHTPEIKSPDGRGGLRILSPPAMAGRMEWYEVEISPGGEAHQRPTRRRHLRAPNGADGPVGQNHARTADLEPGETARYRADVEHEISAHDKVAARALMVVAGLRGEA